MITLNQLKNTIITILSIVENKLDWNNLKNKPFYSTNDGSIKKLDSKYLPDHSHSFNDLTDKPTVDDALTLLMETGYIEPVADEEGIITDDNNVIYTL